MAKKDKWPQKLIAVRLTDGTIIVVEHVDEITEDSDGEPVGIYELRTTGKFEVEKSISGKPPKLKPSDLEGMSHEHLQAVARNLRLKLYTKNMSTKALRRSLREYLEEKAKR